jgi:hypothetical protein
VTLSGAAFTRPARLACVAVVVLPGAVADLTTFDPGVPALALALGGVVAWYHRSSTRALLVAIAAFTAATLTRETMIVFPVTLVAHAAFHRRLRRTDLLVVLVPVMSYAVWSAVVWIRVGDTGARVATHASLALPGRGLVAGIVHWEPAEALMVALAVALVIAAVVRAPTHPLTWICVAYAVASLAMNEVVWRSWLDFARVLLPLYACALLVVLAAPDRRERQPVSTLLRDG